MFNLFGATWAFDPVPSLCVLIKLTKTLLALGVCVASAHAHTHAFSKSSRAGGLEQQRFFPPRYR